MGGALFFCSKTEQSQQIQTIRHTKNTAKSTNVPKRGKIFGKMVDNAPYRGYNEITFKQETKKLPETGQGGKRHDGNERAGT